MLPTSAIPTTNETPMLLLSAVLGRQRNLATWSQLVECGIPPSTISNWVRTHRLFRVHQTVYSMGACRLDTETRTLAAVLAGPDRTAAMSLTALSVWNFTRFHTPSIEIAVPRRTRRALDRVTIRTSCAAAMGHVTEVRGIPVTTIAWTITDLGGALAQEQITHVIQQACFRRLVTRDQVRNLLVRRPTVPGRSRVVAALDAFEAGSSGTRSHLEDIVLRWIREILGRVPLVNIHVTAGDQSFEVDIPVLDLRLCIEVDGPPHDEPDQQERDRVRDAALRAAGFQVERFHWRDIQRNPDACKCRLQQLLLP